MGKKKVKKTLGKKEMRRTKGGVGPGSPGISTGKRKPKPDELGAVDYFLRIGG